MIKEWSDIRGKEGVPATSARVWGGTLEPIGVDAARGVAEIPVDRHLELLVTNLPTVIDDAGAVPS